MAIGTAIQRGSMIYVYDERGRLLWSSSGDALYGYTGSTVSIRRGQMIYTYDERGRMLSSKSAR